MSRRIYYESTTGQIVMITDAAKRVEDERIAYRLTKPSVKVLETTDEVVKNIQNYRIDLSSGSLIQVVMPQPTPLAAQMEELRTQVQQNTLDNQQAIMELYFTVMADTGR